MDKQHQDRINRFREAVRKFHLSSKTSKDYLPLVIASAYALRQGIALTWEEIEQVLKEEVQC